MSDETLFCNSCQHNVASANDRNEHYRSEWHRYNVKRRCAGLLSINQSIFNSQMTALQSRSNNQAANQSAAPAVKVKTKCLTCQKSFASKAAFDSHLLSKKHIKLEADREQSNDQPNQSNSVEYEIKQSNNQTNEQSSDEKDEDDEKMTDDYVPIDYEGYELQFGESPIPVCQCLFCSCPPFETIDQSIEHMHKQHGLFLPFADCLTARPELMKYLGEKIGIGHVCVYCSQRFSTTSACQKHMAAMSHAKLRLESDEDEAEYEDYFDFSASENSGRSLTGRSLLGMTDAGELLLSDGSTIGHRQYQHIYAQRVLLPAARTEGEELASANAQINQSNSQSLIKYDSNGQMIASSGKHINKDKDSGHRYRENWMRKNERRLLLKIGIRNNIQDHYRAQVQF